MAVVVSGLVILRVGFGSLELKGRNTVWHEEHWTPPLSRVRRKVIRPYDTESGLRPRRLVITSSSAGRGTGRVASQTVRAVSWPVCRSFFTVSWSRSQFLAASTLASVVEAEATAAQSGPPAFRTAADCRAITSGAWTPTWALMALPATVRIALMEPSVP